MRHLLVMLVVGVLGFGLAVDHADARRLGGGKTFGSQSRTVQQPAATQNQAVGNRTTQARPGSRMGGMFGGLLAGGLLAALFFGGAFDELRLMDILLVAGAAFVLFKLFVGRRPAIAGNASQAGAPAGVQVDEMPQGSRGAFVSEPEWFDRERFLGDAKAHFMALQRAWDNNDVAGLQEYVTPALYNLLREERDRQPANNRTEIVRLFAELGGIREDDQHAEATVIFHGIIDENGEENDFNETWHLTRQLREGAPWYLQGIEQNPGA